MGRFKTARHALLRRLFGKSEHFAFRTTLLAISILIVVAFVCQSTAARDAGPHREQLIKETFTHENLHRTYYVHVPPNYNPATATPVLLVFHQEYSDPKAMSKLAQFNEVADQNGFIVVYPQGVQGLWNDGRRTDAYRVNDVGFINDLLTMLERRWHIDPRIVCATGFSDGGFFVQYLALKLPGRLTAIASVAANMQGVLVNKLRLKGNVSVLYILGMDDKIVPFLGGPIDPNRHGQNRGICASAADSVSFWVKNNKCGGDYTSEDYPDVDSTDGTRVKVARYQNCPAGNEVVVYAIQNGGHAWPQSRPVGKSNVGKVCRDFDSSDIIFRFFSQHGLGSHR
ncbi:MAG: alpha/beta hydrolase-fold protein [Candidatus Melainabacteria bacterium]|nr:alpha/beta hydrolase-fold protein [Candidatus Melainabacteria bacterium]